MRSCRRFRARDRKRGEPAARCPTRATARRLTPASRGTARASSGQCSRPPRAARQLSAWHRDHAGSAGRVSARRRLRSPLDPRRGHRVRRGAIVPVARLAPPHGRLQNFDRRRRRAGADVCFEGWVLAAAWIGASDGAPAARATRCDTATSGPADRRKEGSCCSAQNRSATYVLSSSLRRSRPPLGSTRKDEDSNPDGFNQYEPRRVQ